MSHLTDYVYEIKAQIYHQDEEIDKKIQASVHIDEEQKKQIIAFRKNNLLKSNVLDQVAKIVMDKVKLDVVAENGKYYVVWKVAIVPEEAINVLIRWY